MHRWMKVHIKVPDGSSRIGSLPNPRRNTSKEFFETFRSGDEAESSLRLVSALYPLCLRSSEEITKSGDKAETVSSS
jgi:hypothetical protein